MLSQGQQDVAHLKHFTQIDSFQSVDLKKEQNKTIKQTNKKGQITEISILLHLFTM